MKLPETKTTLPPEALGGPAIRSEESTPQSRALPWATYRLQFNRRFTLRQAIELIPYLNELGISHIYASPLLKASPGSSHGYDVCDFQQLNPELGIPADFAELIAALRRHGMGLVLDIVPNHMGVGVPENRWWWDVLTHGRSSRYAGHFDFDWEPSDPRLHGKILLPVLGDRYHHVLARGEIRLAHEDGTWVLRYADRCFPVSPQSVSCWVKRTGTRSAEAGSRLTKPSDSSDVGTGDLSRSEPSGLPQTLGEPEDAAINEALEEIAANPEALDALVQAQHYRLTYWRHGDSLLNYRRFFAIATLAGIRVEDGRVFDDVHALIREWVRHGWLDGLRVDHPDGLRNPENYLRRLRGMAPQAWIVVEKIQAAEESLPASWPVDGTTGYDFVNRAGGLFIDPAGEQPMTDFYAEFTGETTD